MDLQDWLNAEAEIQGRRQRGEGDLRAENGASKKDVPLDAQTAE